MENEVTDIRIDQDGIWHYRNVQMTRPDIISYFSKHLHRDLQGRYHIITDCDRCLVQVEDVPFVIKSVSLISEGIDGPEKMLIQLSDGSHEELKPETLCIGENNIIYCQVSPLNHQARFSRQAYYQLAQHIEHDAKSDSYYIKIGLHTFVIATKQPNENGGKNVR